MKHDKNNTKEETISYITAMYMIGGMILVLLAVLSRNIDFVICSVGFTIFIFPILAFKTNKWWRNKK